MGTMMTIEGRRLLGRVGRRGVWASRGRRGGRRRVLMDDVDKGLLAFLNGNESRS